MTATDVSTEPGRTRLAAQLQDKDLVVRATGTYDLVDLASKEVLHRELTLPQVHHVLGVSRKHASCPNCTCI